MTTPVVLQNIPIGLFAALIDVVKCNRANAYLKTTEIPDAEINMRRHSYELGFLNALQTIAELCREFHQYEFPQEFTNESLLEMTQEIMHRTEMKLIRSNIQQVAAEPGQ